MYKAVYLLAAFAALVHSITITVDSFQVGNEGAKAIDGDSATFWHTEYSPILVALPHKAVVDLGSAQTVNTFTYLPRQSGNMNGNIGRYTLESSTDNTAWALIRNATFADDRTLKTVSFTTISARYFRLTALSEAGNRGPWTSAAELTVSLDSTNLGSWGPVIAFPLVPAAAFILHDTGKILTFASYQVNNYGGSGNTWTATYDPSTGLVSEVDITNTHHDMFCPGMSLDINGRAIVTGGDDANKTSIYDPQTNAWITGAQMKIPRGYQSSAILSDGRIFTIGGSWSGGRGGKNGEIYNATSNSWTLLPGCPVAPMLTADAQAGPSKTMNWYGMTGTGTQTAAGLRGTDSDSMDGNAAMYDAVNGKILTLGGSPSYQNSNATSSVHLITIGTPGVAPSVVTLTSMSYRRAFANAVVLPSGQVFVTGGQSYAVPFTDTTAILTPEIWNPATLSFTVLPPHSIPRNYHSVALLMLDGRVFTGGGGLCGSCATNHEDGQIYSPAYLFNSNGTLATRPVVTSISSTTVVVGGTFRAVLNVAAVTFSIIRYGSATHTVDTDQRRIALTPTLTSGTTYTFTIPSDSGAALPGYWMFFALNSAGVPSIAKTIKIILS